MGHGRHKGKSQGTRKRKQQLIEPAIQPQPKITLHALIGSINSKTMRVRGKLGTHWVTILIDSSSTLDPTISRNTQLPLDQANRVHVRLANGELIPSEGKCSGVKFKEQCSMWI